MESHFLDGLEYRLRVEETDFVVWSKFLDGFMLSHQRQYQRQLARSNHEQPLHNSVTIPHSTTFREAPRARSHSPRDNSNGGAMSATSSSPSLGRKRSAGDAFQIDASATTEQVAKSMRIPQRRGYVHLPGAVQQHQRTSGSQLGRATSLTRASPANTQGDRRGSTPAFNPVYNQNQMSESAACLYQSSQSRPVSSHQSTAPLGELPLNTAIKTEPQTSGQPEVGSLYFGRTDRSADSLAIGLLHPRCRSSSWSRRISSKGYSSLPGTAGPVRPVRSAHAWTSIPSHAALRWCPTAIRWFSLLGTTTRSELWPRHLWSAHPDVCVWIQLCCACWSQQWSGIHVERFTNIGPIRLPPTSVRLWSASDPCACSIRQCWSTRIPVPAKRI